MNNFHGLPIAVLENDQIRLEYLTSAGPRIVGLSYHGSTNLLADVFDMAWDTPNGKYFPLGGHRVWISPESPEKTYVPDRTGLSVREIPRGVELTGASETVSGVRKSVRIELEPGAARVRLYQTIVNEGSIPLTFAPWGITQFCLGGTVLLPQPVGNTDPQGFLPNRLLVFWPYTSVHDDRLGLRDDFILIRAIAALPPMKVGYANRAGWLAYWSNGILFRKSFEMLASAVYPDGGCNAEVYCGDRFVELESLGVLGLVAPGQEVHLNETWELYPGLDVPFVPAEIRELLSEKNT
jgi:hypothetical protein